MTSFLQVIAADEGANRRLAHKAAVLSQTRVTNQFGTFLATNGPSALDYLQDEIATVVASACEEVGYEDVDGTLATVLADCGKKHNLPEAFKNNQKKDKDEGESDSDKEIADDEDDEDEKDRFKSSSVHEARKPKMCPFHKDVVDISLASQDPRAGFDSMAQHWGGPRHCDGEGYEGGKCNFKAPMTTQSYWDDRATRAEEKRQERLEQQTDETVLTPITDEAPEQLEDVSPVEDFASEPEGAEVIDFPSSEPSAVGVGYEHAEPMAVAAKIAGEGGVCEDCGADMPDDNSTYCKKCLREKESSVKTADDIQALIQKYIAQGVAPDKAAQLAQQQQRVGPLPTGGQGAGYAPPTQLNNLQVQGAKTADDGLGGKGTPSPKIDKQKWTPTTVKEIPLEGDESRHPTTRTDIAAQGYENSGGRDGDGELTGIGENKTEHQTLPAGGDNEDGAGFAKGGPVPDSKAPSQWSDASSTTDPVTAAAHDVDKNELVEIMKSNYDGFLPQLEVQKAVVAHKRS